MKYTKNFEYDGVYYGTLTRFKRSIEKERVNASKLCKKAGKRYANNPTEENKQVLMKTLNKLANAYSKRWFLKFQYNEVNQA